MQKITGTTVYSRSYRVDFLGPAGVGKSTLCRALLVGVSRNGLEDGGRSQWVALEEASARAERSVQQDSGRDRGAPMVRGRVLNVVRNWLKQRMPSRFRHRGCVRERDVLKRRLLIQFLYNHHAFFEAVAEQWFEPEMVLPPLSVRYCDLLEWTANWLFAITYSAPARILADNSRITRATAELLSNHDYADQERKQALASIFFRLPIRPDGIIHIEGDEGLILDRVLRREHERSGWRHPGHRGLSDDEILTYTQRRNRVNASAVDFFRRHGIPVLTLSASMGLEDNVASAHRFLDEVIASPRSNANTAGEISEKSTRQLQKNRGFSIDKRR